MNYNCENHLSVFIIIQIMDHANENNQLLMRKPVPCFQIVKIIDYGSK